MVELGIQYKRHTEVMAQFVYHSKPLGIRLFLVCCCYGRTRLSDLKVVVEDYIPSLTNDDVNDLVNFVVELFCANNSSGVQNGQESCVLRKSVDC